MTSQLIPVFKGSIANETALLVNARDLHTFLEVGKVFAAWISTRIEEYGFEENKDFVVFSNSGKNSVGRRRKDYHLTLDTAKELAMVERNEKGRQIRRYFIECEKKLRNMQSAQVEQQPQLKAEDIIMLCYVQLWMEKAQQLSKQLSPVMRELNSDYYGKLFDLAYETRHITNKTREALLREAAKLDPANYTVHRARSMLAQLWARQFEF